MSANPDPAPIMHPEALWSLADVTAYFKKRDISMAHLASPDFPRPFRPFGRGHRLWNAGEIFSYLANYPSPPVVPSEHVLYRFFDEHGELLYVGVSLSAAARFRAHRAQSPWFPFVARIELQRFPTRKDALAAESAAIKSERPKFNRV